MAMPFFPTAPRGAADAVRIRLERQSGSRKGVALVTTHSRSSSLVVVPCYNESARLPGRKFLDFLDNDPDVRFLFVNDGSRDQTLAVLEELRAARPERIEILDKQPNGGKAEAVRAGLVRAIEEDSASLVGFWDADLSTPLEVLPEFVRLLSGNDRLQMVFGSRVRLLGHDVVRRATRHYLGRVFASFASMSLRLPIYDTQCGAKLFRSTPELALVLRQPFLTRWVFDVEILARYIAMNKGDVSYLRDSIYEYPLPRWHDVAGSKVHPGDFFRGAVDLLRIYNAYLAPWDKSKAKVAGAVSTAAGLDR
jgi:dolichyl-phosphate beta-glucosyltransferase